MSVPLPPHLPTTQEELRQRGWNELDVILVTGDAHVDHPAFPAALLGRVLEAAGLRVGIIARPGPEAPEQVARLGPPRLFFGVTAGALDSMVANYTALRRRRSDDPYAPGGIAGGRPDRALTVYCQLVRRAFGKRCLIVAGGLEASLRRLAHYDYWTDKVRRPVLMDCGADVLVHGMGEAPVLDLARRLDALPEAQRHDPVRRLDAIRDVPGLVHRTPARSEPPADGIELPSAEAVSADGAVQAEAFGLQEANRQATVYQQAGGMRVIVNPPAPSPSSAVLDGFHDLAFRRQVHPVHAGQTVPALEQVRFSVTTHRGCFGGCSFCAISAHQGRDVASRSRESILAEVGRIAAHPDFRGTVNDLGGPTANMWGYGCRRGEACQRPSCLWPKRCRHLVGDQHDYLDLLDTAAATSGVKHLFVTTGLRMDLALECEPLLAGLATRYTSGHLKVAPEHLVPEVLALMRKPAAAAFERFLTKFRAATRAAGKRQFVLPYLMAAHPGSRLEDMLEVALFLRREELRVEQVQIFTPTPGTAATLMYATGRDPASGRSVFVERGDKGKRLQKALLLSHLPESQPLVSQALDRLSRPDLRRLLAPDKARPPGKKKRKRRKRRR